MGTPAPGPACVCTSSRFGLLVNATLPVVGAITVGPLSNIITVGASGDPVFAAVLPTTLNESPGICSARSAVTDLELNLPGLSVAASVLEARVLAPCDPCGGSGTSSIARLVVNNTILIDVAAGLSVSSRTTSCPMPVASRRPSRGTVARSPPPWVRALHISANTPDCSAPCSPLTSSWRKLRLETTPVPAR